MSDIFEKLKRISDYWMPRDIGARVEIPVLWIKESTDEIERLREHLHTLIATKSVIENIVKSEVEPLKALLRESVKEAFDDAYVLHPEGVDLLRRIRAALGDEP